MKRYLGSKKVMRIYLDNSDIFDGKPLWQELFKKIKEENLAGATLIKASAGIGVHSELHTFEIWSLSQKLPIIIEVIESEDNIYRFLERYDSMIGEGLVTLSDIDVIRYKSVTKGRD